MNENAIPRIDKDGTPVLFFPDDPVSKPGMIVCYAHIGQHSEASKDYYWNDTKPDKSNDCADLIREYENLGRCKLTVKRRLPSRNR